tara:strand:+ start:3080 stop:4003 length:924 start_codon:yes stop_codon:yes gene_type:complete
MTPIQQMLLGIGAVKGEWWGTRAVQAFGYWYKETSEYITIGTLGNASSFGSWTNTRRMKCAGMSNSVRHVIAAGDAHTSSYAGLIQYVTIGTTSNAIAFGQCIHAYERSGASDGIYGIIYTTPYSGYNYIEYITIETTGNGTNFGLVTQKHGSVGCMGTSGHARALFYGGYMGGVLDYINYLTPSTPGNTSDFGNLTLGRYGTCGTGDETRGICGGGEPQSGNAGYNHRTIDYVTMATTGNATDFGDLQGIYRQYLGEGTNNTRVLFTGGWNNNKTIDYITAQTTGNGADFGDLITGRDMHTSGSGQ